MVTSKHDDQGNIAGKWPGNEEHQEKSVSQEDIADLKEVLKDHAAMKQDMQKLLSKIDCLSNKNEELQGKLKEKYESLSENIEKTHQPSLESHVARTSTITALLSMLDELATQMVPKETTDKRRSIIESHDNEVRTAHGFLSKDSFGDITGSPILPRTCSASSSGRGTLSRSDSNKLFTIDEDGTSQSEDQVSSQATDVQQSLPPSASKVPLRPKKTSTPAVSIISEKEQNYLGVVWAMSDLTVAIKKLLETDPK